jgi:hypothetical protein
MSAGASISATFQRELIQIIVVHLWEVSTAGDGAGRPARPGAPRRSFGVERLLYQIDGLVR